MKWSILKIVILLGSLVGYASSLKCFICTVSPNIKTRKCQEHICSDAHKCVNVISPHWRSGCSPKQFLNDLGVKQECEDLAGSEVHRTIFAYYNPILDHHKAILRNSSVSESQNYEARDKINTLQDDLEHDLIYYGGGKNARVCQCETDLCNNAWFGETLETNGQGLKSISVFAFIITSTALGTHSFGYGMAEL